MHSFNVYIDEAGDDGIKPDRFRSPGTSGSSHWLAIGAAIIRASRDTEMVSNRDAIIDVFKRKKKKREIHFRELGHEQKLFACQAISEMPIRASVVMSNKTTIPSHPRKDLFSDKNTLYWYLTKYLVERISHCCAQLRPKVSEGNGCAKIIFSKRGNMNYRDFQDYLHKIKIGNTKYPEQNNINWNIVDIDAIEALDHSKRAGLQIADCITSAFFTAVEPNFYGMTERRYADQLKRIVYNRNGRYIGHGLKYVPSLDKMELNKAQEDFLMRY